MSKNIDAFLSVKSLADLTQVLGEKSNEIISLLQHSRDGTNYCSGYIKKKSGGERIIYIPKVSLKKIQNKLLLFLQEIYIPSQCEFGFIKGRNIILNSINHVKKNTILNIDLKDFFPSIKREKVKLIFENNPFFFNKKISTILSLLCCNRGELPQGAPTSPIISNMACENLDSQLKNIARDNYSYYTRYVDDLTFSTYKNKINDNLLENIKKIIKEEGFKINNKKFRIQSKYQRQEVTGISVNLKLNVKRKYVRYIRALLYSWKKNGYEEASRKFFVKTIRTYPHKKYKPIFENSLRGKIDYLGLVRGRNDSIYLKHKEIFNKLYAETIKEKEIDLN